MNLLSPGLRAFLSVVRAKTVHGAASELGLTQTAVTQRIRALEDSLGVTLFLRSRKGMTPTEQGEALLQYCLGAEELEGQVAARLGQSATEVAATITLIGPTSAMVARVSPQCLHLYKKWPLLSLQFIVNDEENRLEWLKKGKVDLALIRPHQVVNELDSKLLKPEQFLLVGHPKWKGRKINDILSNERIIDFHKDDPTTLNYLKHFDLYQHVQGERLYVNNNEILIRHFCEGVGFGTLTKEVAQPFLKSGQLIKLNRGAEMSDPLALAWYPRANMPSYLREAIASIK